MAKIQYVFDTTKTIHYRFPTHVNDLVMDRAQAETSEVFFSVMEPGEAPPLHVHDDTEQVFFVVEGAGLLQIGDSPERQPVKPGNLVRIPPHTYHRVFCDGPKALRYLCIDCFVGGRPKDEPTWESHVQAICKLNGWDLQKVMKLKASRLLESTAL
jgi:mannose-6-phosphate isomerase-like protein (cupin superfamily)